MNRAIVDRNRVETDTKTVTKNEKGRFRQGFTQTKKETQSKKDKYRRTETET